jgi:hypothetical protein
MTRNGIASASHCRRITEPGTSSRRPRRTGLRVEGLETRLALSSDSTGPVLPDLNPQPLTPGIVIAHPALNPQPLPPGGKTAQSVRPGFVVTKRVDTDGTVRGVSATTPNLSPQPLPPGIVVAIGKLSPDSDVLPTSRQPCPSVTYL